MANKRQLDLFKEVIPAIDQGGKDLWDLFTDEQKKEIKNDFFVLNRYISSAKTNNRDTQEYFVEAVNEFYNKNWALMSNHPKLQWLCLCLCGHPSKKEFFHEWIPLKKEKNKKETILSELFPNMKNADIETLAAITTEKEIKQYCEGLGWDKKQINGIKL